MILSTLNFEYALALDSTKRIYLHTLKLLAWNIEGFITKCSDNELLAYLRKHDIIGLLESLVEDQTLINHILTDFDSFFLQRGETL